VRSWADLQSLLEHAYASVGQVPAECRLVCARWWWSSCSVHDEAQRLASFGDLLEYQLLVPRFCVVSPLTAVCAASARFDNTVQVYMDLHACRVALCSELSPVRVHVLPYGTASMSRRLATLLAGSAARSPPVSCPPSRALLAAALEHCCVGPTSPAASALTPPPARGGALTASASPTVSPPGEREESHGLGKLTAPLLRRLFRRLRGEHTATESESVGAKAQAKVKAKASGGPIHVSAAGEQLVLHTEHCDAAEGFFDPVLFTTVDRQAAARGEQEEHGKEERAEARESAEVADAEVLSLSRAVVRVIRDAPETMRRKQLCGGVVLSGPGSGMSGLGERLQREVQGSIAGECVQVITGGAQGYEVWCGCVLLLDALLRQTSDQFELCNLFDVCGGCAAEGSGE
jgi:Actin